MLVELAIRNLAVIEKVHISFRQGFHVLTGETGAGKSIIIDALSLIAGGRGSADLVRFGSEKAEIEALFEIDATHPAWDILSRQGIEAQREEPLVIRREVTIQGKSTSRINGQLINLSMLREVGEWLVNIHGQHEHQSLLKVDQHLPLLDLYGEAEISPVKNAYQASYHRYQRIVKELDELRHSTQQTLQMIDLYKFQVNEISDAGLKTGEDESLSEEKRKLANAEKLTDAVSASYDMVYGNQKGLEAIGKAMNRLEDISTYDPSVLQPLVEQIQSAYYQLEDAAYQLRDYRDQIEFNPARLDQIEERLDLISSLRRKYGPTVEDILQHLDKIKQELELIENKDAKIGQLQKDAERELTNLVRHAAELSDKRHLCAEMLSQQIEDELSDLQMERTRFKVQLEKQPDARGVEVQGETIKYGEQGWDQTEFLISANPGEPLRPLHKIASGGELSRIMLALKSIFARMDRIPVLIFDEVDTGVSGKAAQAIAEKLSKLSLSCQVFSITHLPQVACMADAHYLIEKEIEGERTFTLIHHLGGKERIIELARMLGGVEVTATTQQHAQEMLAMAGEKKSSL